jgi:hypothetical protein
MPGEALARYNNAMREAALADAQERPLAGISPAICLPVRFSHIDETALRAWPEQWKSRIDRHGGWNWREQRLALRSTLGRFGLALFSADLQSANLRKDQVTSRCNSSGETLLRRIRLRDLWRNEWGGYFLRAVTWESTAIDQILLHSTSA